MQKRTRIDAQGNSSDSFGVCWLPSADKLAQHKLPEEPAGQGRKRKAAKVEMNKTTCVPAA